MPGASDDLAAPRRTLLDALGALDSQLDALVLIGAQAIYIWTAEARVALAATTNDSDLAVDRRLLADEPRLEEAMTHVAVCPVERPSRGGTVISELRDLPAGPRRTKALAPGRATLENRDRIAAGGVLEPELVAHVIGYPPIAEDADVSDGRLQYVSGESHLRGRKPSSTRRRRPSAATTDETQQGRGIDSLTRGVLSWAEGAGRVSRVVPALLDAPSPLVSRHLTVGCSTGYMVDSRGDWRTLVEQAAATSTLAVELSALSEAELPGLVGFLRGDLPMPFHYLSVHAPSKGLALSEDERVGLLMRLPPRVRAIVTHPDVIEDVAAWRPLGRRLVIENMDARKSDGQTADELAPLFEALPLAGFCFDIAHAKHVDPTLAEGRALLDRFVARPVSYTHLTLPTKRIV